MNYVPFAVLEPEDVGCPFVETDWWASGESSWPVSVQIARVPLSDDNAVAQSSTIVLPG
jgi:hypothetical protein